MKGILVFSNEWPRIFEGPSYFQGEIITYVRNSENNIDEIKKSSPPKLLVIIFSFLSQKKNLKSGRPIIKNENVNSP